MKILFCVAVALVGLSVKAAPAEGKGAADAGAPKAKAVAVKPSTPLKTDAGMILKSDAGTTAKVDAGSPSKSDAGISRVTESTVTASAYTLVAVAAPDKKTERLWKARCSACHGVDGKAGTEKGKKMKMQDLTDSHWQTTHGTSDLRRAILEGTKQEKDGVTQEMDSFKDELTEAQVNDLLAYVRWLGAPH